MSDDGNNGKLSENSDRDQRGRFAKGNPGKPHGARYKHVLAAETLLDGELEALTRTCVEAAQNGDMTAMRLVLERVMPPRKSRPVQFAMPPLKSAADAPNAMAAIIEAASAGELSPGEAESYSRLVTDYIKVIEVTDLEKRVRAIEAAASK